MPRKKIELISDDFDGKELPEDTKPVTLSLGRTTYNLYLSDANHGKLLDVLEPFTKDAEVASEPRLAPAVRANKANEDNKKARKWAIETGFKYENAAGEKVTLGERGRIPASVIEAWQVAGSPDMASD